MIWRAEPDEVWQALAGLDFGFVAAAVVLVLIDRSLMAVRWMALLAPAEGVRPPVTTLIRIFFVSTFVGSFLPASVGGDAVRAWSLSREGVTSHEAMASVLMDRLLGVVSLLLMASAGLLLAPMLAGNVAVLLALGATLLGCAAGLALVFSRATASLGMQLLRRLPEGRVNRGAGRLIGALQAYRGHRRVAGYVLAASVAVQVLRVLQAWLLGLAIGMATSLSAYFAFVPLILIVMLLPITINGIGTSQAAFVFFFAQAGAAAADAFALSVLFLALGLIGNLPGAVFYASRSRRV